MPEFTSDRATAGQLALDSHFAELSRRWQAIVPPARGSSFEHFLAMEAEARAIRARGYWASGPTDVLSIVGRQRDELLHSRFLAWLLQPTSPHGLGDRFLRGLLESVWPNEALHDGGTVEIELERSRSAVDVEGDDALKARADVIIRLESAVIVIENKLDAGEQPDQCERLYQTWANEATKVRWLFLTPTGRSPATASSAKALAAWRTASYAHVWRLLATAIDATPDAPSSTGRSSAVQYLATLAAAQPRGRPGEDMTNPFDDERLRFFLEHRDDIRDWAAIERDVVVATREILAASQAALDERLASVDPDATTTRRDGGRYERIVIARPGWPSGVGVALEWETGIDPFGSHVPKYGILFLNQSPDLEVAHRRIESLASRTPTVTTSRLKVSGDNSWPAVRFLDKSTDWWRDPAAWSKQIVDALIDLWRNAADVIEEGLAPSE